MGELFMENFVEKVFAEKLRELRTEKNLSTVALGKELNVSNSTICRWEKCEIVPTITHLYNIAMFFCVSTDYLLGLED